MNKTALSPPNAELIISRSSSMDQTPNFLPDDKIENSHFSIEPPSHLSDGYHPLIDYTKFIISPGQVQQNNTDSISNYNNGSFNSEQNNKINPNSKSVKTKKKRKLMPISKAKDQVMQMMKLSNDEYIAQVENIKRSEKSLNEIKKKIKNMGPVKFDLMNHPIIYEIAMHNYTIDYCTNEIDRIKLNIDSYAILYNEIDKNLSYDEEKITNANQSLDKKEEQSQNSNSILVNEESTHRSSVDVQNARPRQKMNILRRRTNPTKRTSLPIDSDPIIQSQEQSPIQPTSEKQKSNNKISLLQSQPQSQPQKKFLFQKRPQTPPQQPIKNQQQILPQNCQITRGKLVDLSGFISECLTLRTNPIIFIQRRSLLHKLSHPNTLDHPIEFIDPNKPSEQYLEVKEEQKSEETDNSNATSEKLNQDSKTATLLSKLKEDAKNSFIINPSVDKVGYLLNPKVKSGRIIQRFILKANEMAYEDIEVIADALFELASDYLTRYEIISILFDIIWSLNPSKYPIVPRVNTFWVPYLMDLIPAAVDPPYLNEKWKRMTFIELSYDVNFPLRKAVDSLFELYLHSSPFEIGRCFSNTIHLVASAVQEMVREEGGNPDEVEIDFDQLFNLLIICIFASGLPTITEPLSYASYFDQYACDDNEIHFAMSHMEGLCAHLPKMNFKELREKSNKLKEQYLKEEENI